MKNVENTTKKDNKICIINSKAPKPIIKNLELLGYEVLLLPPLKGLASKESRHVDMQLCRISEQEIVFAPGVDGEILTAIEKRNFTVIEGNTLLKRNYPENIAYNVLVTDTMFLHNTKFTDSQILKKLQDGGLTPVLTKQFYSPCCAIVLSTKNNSTIILTGDCGIFKICREKGIETIFCEGVENIRLAGYNHGFVGGCCGKDGKVLYTCGSFEKTFYNGRKIRDSLKKQGINVVNLWGGKLRDIGGMLIL